MQSAWHALYRHPHYLRSIPKSHDSDAAQSNEIAVWMTNESVKSFRFDGLDDANIGGLFTFRSTTKFE